MNTEICTTIDTLSSTGTLPISKGNCAKRSNQLKKSRYKGRFRQMYARYQEDESKISLDIPLETAVDMYSKRFDETGLSPSAFLTELISLSRERTVQQSSETVQQLTDQPYGIPLNTGQPGLVQMLVGFFEAKQIPSDAIIRTLYRVLDAVSPLEASRMREGKGVLFEDLPEAIGKAITWYTPDYTKISDAILEGLLDHSKLTIYTIREVVQRMYNEVCTNQK